jgi:hypothetical protein
MRIWPPWAAAAIRAARVHVDADVVAAAEYPVPCVEPHPDPQRAAVGPGVGGQATLRGDGRSDRLNRAGEGHEEGVALDADDHATRMLDGLGDDGRVLVLHGRIPIPELLEQCGRPLDVREQERDRSGRQVRHGAAECTAWVERRGRPHNRDSKGRSCRWHGCKA